MMCCTSTCEALHWSLPLKGAGGKPAGALRCACLLRLQHAGQGVPAGRRRSGRRHAAALQRRWQGRGRLRRAGSCRAARVSRGAGLCQKALQQDTADFSPSSDCGLPSAASDCCTHDLRRAGISRETHTACAVLTFRMLPQQSLAAFWPAPTPSCRAGADWELEYRKLHIVRLFWVARLGGTDGEAGEAGAPRCRQARPQQPAGPPQRPGSCAAGPPPARGSARRPGAPPRRRARAGASARGPPAPCTPRPRRPRTGT